MARDAGLFLGLLIGSATLRSASLPLMLQRFGESFTAYSDKKLQNENNRKVKFMR